MTMPYVAELLAADHGAELREQARSARLAVLMSCCRPSTWSRAARRAAQAVHRVRAGLARPGSVPACCTA